MNNNNNRGQVGIGTLIVFIAMVLVAAIAAGVLINTAGFLQAQAEATGEESAEQVSDRVEVISVIGSAQQVAEDSSTPPSAQVEDLGSSNINLIEVSIRRGAGADNIDLTNAIIEVFAKGESATLTHEALADGGSIDTSIGAYDQDDFDDSDASLTDGTFRIVNVQNADGGVLSDSSDRADLVFELSGVGNGATLSEGDSVTLTITTASGGTAFVEKRAPSTITDGDSYRL